MKQVTKESTRESLRLITGDRDRTNILKKWEQQAIGYLVQRIPSWISSDGLTFIGFMGSVLTCASFVMAAYWHVELLLLGVLGFAISWFGDSLDGRLAYYRKKERKNYGFALDITADWLGIILMGVGFIVYMDGWYELLGFAFVVLYGWEMITALLRYQISGKYSIDNGILGPTEVRIIISLILVVEVLVNGSILYASILACIILFVANIIDTRKLLKIANEVDIRQKEENKSRYL